MRRLNYSCANVSELRAEAKEEGEEGEEKEEESCLLFWVDVS